MGTKTKQETKKQCIPLPKSLSQQPSPPTLMPGAHSMTDRTSCLAESNVQMKQALARARSSSISLTMVMRTRLLQSLCVPVALELTELQSRFTTSSPLKPTLLSANLTSVSGALTLGTELASLAITMTKSLCRERTPLKESTSAFAAPSQATLSAQARLWLVKSTAESKINSEGLLAFLILFCLIFTEIHKNQN